MNMTVLDPHQNKERKRMDEQKPQTILSLESIRKAYGTFQILKSLRLEAFDGEFLSLLGPSGCGKTTTLRIIAGFERPDAGVVILGGQEITSLPPNKRDVSTVFQDYSLFPHMTVAENVAFGLVERKMAKTEIAARVAEMLDMVRLGDFADRKPGQLSGGQKQRVALARSLAVRPRILLLDEPLGALDLKLRKAMQLELRSFQQRLGITFIYVTHDQEEALTMSDRIVVMKGGEIQQIGGARAIYDRPANRFVADFIGETTLLDGVVASADAGSGLVQVDTPSGPIRVVADNRPAMAAGQRCCVSVRPEKVRIGEGGANTFDARVETVTFRGPVVEYALQLEKGKMLRASGPATASGAASGDRIKVGWDIADAVLLEDV
ncbi:ABC transporter ATP-binding protein (plasmid) [Aquamicrobium terrae]